jgi:hypothetical protein
VLLPVDNAGMNGSDMSDLLALRSWRTNLIHPDDDEAIGW